MSRMSAPEGSYEIFTTALHLDIEKHDLHIALWLMKAGARINVEDVLHKTLSDWFQYDGSQTTPAIIIFLIWHSFQ